MIAEGGPGTVATAATLSHFFPEADAELLQSVAESCKGQWDASIARLLSFGLELRPPVVASDEEEEEEEEPPSPPPIFPGKRCRPPVPALASSSSKKVATAATLAAVFEGVDAEVLQSVASSCGGDWDASVQRLQEFGCFGDAMDNLRAALPGVDDAMLRDIVDSCRGDWQAALVQLVQMGVLPRSQTPTPPNPRQLVHRLRDEFPGADPSLLEDIVAEVDGDYDAACGCLAAPPPIPLPPTIPLPPPLPTPPRKDPKEPQRATPSALSSFYPKVDASLLRDVADMCRGSWSASVEQLASLGFSPEGEVPQDPDDACSAESSEDSEWEDQFDEAVAVGEEWERHRLATNTVELLRKNMGRIKQQMDVVTKTLQERERQKRLGPQSTRGMSDKDLRQKLSGHDPHARQCFYKMLDREKEHCGEYVVFYHSYSFAALMYEVQAAIARVLYELPRGYAALPRVLKKPFLGKPHISILLADFDANAQDHDPRFREVAISASVSLLAPGSEAPPTSVFENGYSCSDLSFRAVMKNLFKTLGVAESGPLIEKLCQVAEKWGVHTGAYKEGGNVWSTTSQGHMLQIFVAADVVDDLAYASHAMGVVDDTRNPLSKSLTGVKWPDGQARIFVHPAMFLDPNKVKLYHYTANKKLHADRALFQDELLKVLSPVLGETKAVLRAYAGVEGKL